MSACRRCVVALALCVTATTAPAQEMHGTVRDSASGRVLQGAMVTLLDSTAQMIAAIRTPRTGVWRFTIPASGRVALDVRLVGFAPLTSGWITVAPTDTFDVTLRLHPIAFQLSEVRVEAQRDSIAEAVRGLLGLDLRSLGGRFITPAQIDVHRAGAVDYMDLLRSQALPGYFVREIDTRTGIRCYAQARPPAPGCLMVVVDGMRVDPMAAVEVAPPYLVDYAFVLKGQEAGVLWGTGSSNGVLYIATKGARKTGQ